MGYSASGSLTITFPSVEARDAAVAAANAEDQSGDTIVEVLANAGFETYAASAETVEFTAYAYDKWGDWYWDAVQPLAAFASSLSGEFRGEDDSGWGWTLKDNNLYEYSLVDVPDYEYEEFKKANDAVTAIAELLTNPDTDPEQVLGAVTTTIREFLTAEQLTVLASHSDEQVRAAVTAHLTEPRHEHVNNPMPSRLPGPASTDPDLTYLLLLDGTQTWSLNRELHRPDGPAVISPDGTSQYFLYGRVVTPATHAYYNNPDPANVSLLPTFEERYNLVTLRQFAYEHRRDLVLAESDRDQLLQAFLAFATGEEIARLAADTADDPEIQAQISELVLFISSL